MGAEQAQIKTRRKVPASQLANLRPNPQYLKRGGKKARTRLTALELEFCNLRAEGLSVNQICAELDIQRWKATDWLYRPGAHTDAIQAEIAACEERMKKDIEGQSKERVKLRHEFLDRHYMTSVRKAVAPKKIDPFKVAKLFETGYKSIGAIQTQSTNVNAQAVASAQAIATVQNRAFVPKWRQETLKAMEENAAVSDQRPPESAELSAS